MRTRLLLVVTLLVVSPALLAGPSVQAAISVDLNPVADAYVDASEPATNFGGASRLWVWTSFLGTFNRRGYLKFDLSGLPQTARVSRATLWLFLDVFSKSETSQVAVHSVADNTWEELRITWRNAPALGPKLYTNDTVARPQTWYSWVVTSAVATRLQQQVSFAVLNENQAGIDSYPSREGSRAPVLRVEYTLPETNPPSIADIRLTPAEPTVEDVVVVTASVRDDASGVAEVILVWSWRVLGVESEQRTPMTLMAGSTYRAIILQQPSGTTVRLRVEAKDGSDNVATSTIVSYTVKRPAYYTELERQFLALQGDVQRLQANLTRLATELTQVKAERDRLRSDVETLRANVTTLLAERDRLRSDVDQLKAERARLRNQVEALQANVTAVQAERDRIATALSQASKRVGELTKELSDLQGQLRQTRADLAQAKGELGTIKSERDRLRDQLDTMKQELETTSAALSRISNELAQTTSQLSRVRAEFESTRASLEAAETSVSQWQLISALAAAVAVGGGLTVGRLTKK